MQGRALLAHDPGDPEGPGLGAARPAKSSGRPRRQRVRRWSCATAEDDLFAGMPVPADRTTRVGGVVGFRQIRFELVRTCSSGMDAADVTLLLESLLVLLFSACAGSSARSLTRDDEATMPGPADERTRRPARIHGGVTTGGRLAQLAWSGAETHGARRRKPRDAGGAVANDCGPRSSCGSTPTHGDFEG